jgi:hypothetical protein
MNIRIHGIHPKIYGETIIEQDIQHHERGLELDDFRSLQQIIHFSAFEVSVYDVQANIQHLEEQQFCFQNENLIKCFKVRTQPEGSKVPQK